jgi:hypothetical protein
MNIQIDERPVDEPGNEMLATLNRCGKSKVKHPEKAEKS